MTHIHFSLPYITRPGQSLQLHMATAGSPQQTYAMTSADGQLWTCDIDVCNDADPVDYFFSVNSCEREERREWTTVAHRLELGGKQTEACYVCCRWNDMPCDSYLYSSAFTDCVNRHACGSSVDASYARTLRVSVRAPQLRAGSRLQLVGQAEALGQWDPGKALPMHEHNYNEWVADIDLDAVADAQATEFKFIAVTSKGNVLWETGRNRTFASLPVGDAGMVVWEQDQAFFEIFDEKLAGTLVPVFSLRTQGSFGVGDFGDLKAMIDWVADIGQRVLQVLPVNDTTATHTWADCYPYSCISVFALHPQYADLRQLPAIADADKARQFEQLREELNALPQIDYERVNNAKANYLRAVFAQEGKTVMASLRFKQFLKENEHWIVPYAQYCHFRDIFHTADFSQWTGHEHWNEADRGALMNPRTHEYADVAFHYYVQYILDQQMRAAHEYAKSRGVVLKGDIPIGVNRNGCDVWHESQYFNLDSQAGAPPDAFATNGQNWGFPTYNWQRMLDDGCRWWIRRFQNMSKFFDAYRIDHVLGFFRIWAIPTTCVHGLLGQFDPALALSPEAIRAYGLHFDEKRFTTPFVTRHMVEELFGDRAETVIDTYLDCEQGEPYALKPEYDTERKIEAAFGCCDSDADESLRDRLYRLVEDVLFVRDAHDAGLFHPRITAQTTFAYRMLSDGEKDSFNRLYNDYYYRRNNQFWYQEAMRKLPVLVQATRMLVCAEDLGMVPDCVPWVMQQLRILSLELQQMPKAYGLTFGNLNDNPYRSVCTLSTHDMPTLRQWWDEDSGRTQLYFNTELHRSGEAPHPLSASLATEIVANQLASPSMLCILSLQDWLSMDERLRLPDANGERINIPANPHHYWRYRMHLNIDDLRAATPFCDHLRRLLAQTGRRVDDA